MSYDPWDDPVRKMLRDMENDPARKMMRDMERMRRMMDPSPDVLRQVRQDFDQLRVADPSREIFRIEGDLNEIRDLVKEIESRGAILRQFEQGQEIYRGIQRMNEVTSAASLYRDVMEKAGAVGDIFSRHRGLIDSYVLSTFQGSSVPSVGRATGSPSFQRTSEEFAESYEKVSELMDSEGGENIPPEVRVEAFVGAEVVEELAVSGEEGAQEGQVTDGGEAAGEQEAGDRQDRRQLVQELQQQGNLQLRLALEALEPQLVKMWDGSSQALSSSNPDRIRHFSASRRELTTHVLHLLAPDKAVRDWGGDNPSLFHQGRPTRKARLRYICRSIDREDFGEFVKIDYEFMLDTLDFFQKGTHALEPSFTPEQQTILITRADQHLLFLLQLGKFGNNRN